MERELHSNVDERVAVNSATIVTDTTTVGNTIDTQGFESLEYILSIGNWTTGDFSLLLEESDAANMAGSNVVAASERLGALVILGADNAITRVGVIAKKRYQRASIVSADTASSLGVGAIALLGHPKTAPVAQ